MVNSWTCCWIKTGSFQPLASSLPLPVSQSESFADLSALDKEVSHKRKEIKCFMLESRVSDLCMPVKTIPVETSTEPKLSRHRKRKTHHFRYPAGQVHVDLIMWLGRSGSGHRTRKQITKHRPTMHVIHVAESAASPSQFESSRL